MKSTSLLSFLISISIVHGQAEWYMETIKQEGSGCPCESEIQNTTDTLQGEIKKLEDQNDEVQIKLTEINLQMEKKVNSTTEKLLLKIDNLDRQKERKVTKLNFELEKKVNNSNGKLLQKIESLEHQNSEAERKMAELKDEVLKKLDMANNEIQRKINKVNNESQQKVDKVNQQNKELQNQLINLQDQLSKLQVKTVSQEACFEDMANANCTGSKSGLVGIVEAIRIDGGWGSYSNWSECSTTCGGGVQVRRRTCNNPVPQYGGKLCSGVEEEQKECNAGTCCTDEVALIVGGWGENSKKAELWSPGGKCNRKLKDLPDGKYHGITTNYINVNGGLILSCGGYTWKNKCYSLNVGTEEWEYHSTTLKERSYHSSVVINDTTLYLIGGNTQDSGSTTEYLEPGTTIWKEGPKGNVKAGTQRYGSCSVQTSANTFVVHGGLGCRGGKCENEYSFITKKWTRFGNAAEAYRYFHGCTIVQTEDIFGILIAGGAGSSTSFFLDLKANSPEWRKFSNLNFSHHEGRNLKLNGRYFILGGRTSMKVEENHPGNGTWTTGLPDFLYTRGGMYGTTAVPRNMFSNCN